MRSQKPEFILAGSSGPSGPLLERPRMPVGLKQPHDVALIKGFPAGVTCSPNAYPWILSATILASSMVFIDGSAVNLALPVLQTELHATNVDAQWIIEAYALFLASLMLVGGSLGDRLGRKRVFLWGVIGFAAASALCASVQTATQLIVARAVQGMASALLTPGSLSILGASFDERQRGKAIGTWSSFSALTAVIGPLVGGVIVQHASWRWIFLINVPLAIGAIVATVRWVPESRDDHQVRGVDWPGALLATLGLGAVVYALITAGGVGWSPTITAWLLGGVILLVVFAMVEAKVPAPMMPPSLFSSRTFSVINLQTLMLYAALGGALFLLPFDLILIQHYSPTAAGAAFLPFVVLLTLLSPWAGSLCTSIGAKIPLVVGSTIAALALAGFALPSIGGTYWTTFFAPTVVLGLGMALVVAPLTTAVMDSVDKDHFGVASGINNAVSRTASLLAVATLSLVVAGTFNERLSQQLASIAPSPQIAAAVDAQRPKLAAAQAPQTASKEVQQQIDHAIAASYVSGFRLAMVLAALLALIGAGCAAFGLPSGHRARSYVGKVTP